VNSHLVSLLYWLVLLTLTAQAAVAAPAADLAARVEAAARQFVLEQASTKGLADAVVELKLATGPAPLPTCRDAVTVDALETRSITRMRFAAVCTGAEGWQREWIVRAELTAKVVVAAADVRANQALAESDLALERRRVMDLADALPDTEAAVGKASSRALRSGQLVSARWLAAPLLVRRGESVTILARNGGIEVQAAGVALEPGRLLEVVRVRNATTAKVIRARVIEAGTVEPEIIGGSSRGQSSD
jgi:flagella basal body P-ring formation protein FlgA